MSRRAREPLTYGTSIEIEYFGCPDDGDGFADKFELYHYATIQHNGLIWILTITETIPMEIIPICVQNTDELFRGVC